MRGPVPRKDYYMARSDFARRMSAASAGETAYFRVLAPDQRAIPSPPGTPGGEGRVRGDGMP